MVRKREAGRKGQRLWMLTAAFLLFCTFLAGCAGNRQDMGKNDADAVTRSGQMENNGKLKVAATLFPYYDFAREIGGENIDLTMVVPAGMDSHSFEPTPKDMITIQNADLILCNGGEMERWLFQVLEAIEPRDRAVLAAMDVVEVYEEEIVEGMENSEHGHEHDHQKEAEAHKTAAGHETGDEQEEDDSLHIEYDEHVWTAPANAVKIAEEIGGMLSKMDAEHAEEYQERTAVYCEKLRALDQEFRDIVDQSGRKTLVFADKFPFRYFAEEFGLKYYAAFTGCSGDSEPSARTIAFLIDKVKKEAIPAVYYLELSSPRVAEIIEEETGAKPMLFHSCHNLTRLQFDSGITYLELMRKNEEVLKAGLR